MRVAIVGAGMAGLACGEALREAGHAVSLFDKGRRPGGRMSTKLAGEGVFDYGAPYLAVTDPTFAARVERWRRAGVVAPWPAAGRDAFVGTPGMSAPLAEMAGRLPVSWSSRIDALRREDGSWHLDGEGSDDARYDAVVVAVPAEQAGPLLAAHDDDMAAQAAATRSLPRWTVMATFAERLPVEADIVDVGGILAARDSAKPGRAGPEAWTIHAAPDWSLQHLEDAREAVVAPLLAAFADALGRRLPAPTAAKAHRWRYALSGAAGTRCLWSRGIGLGTCGDWLIGPDVEAAWLSGTALAGAIVASQGTAGD